MHAPLCPEPAPPDEDLLTIQEVGRTFRRTEGAIRTAIWRYHRYGVDPGIPLPKVIAGRYRWLRSAVAAHLKGIAEQPESVANPEKGTQEVNNRG